MFKIPKDILDACVKMHGEKFVQAIQKYGKSKISVTDLILDTAALIQPLALPKNANFIQNKASMIQSIADALAIPVELMSAPVDLVSDYSSQSIEDIAAVAEAFRDNQRKAAERRQWRRLEAKVSYEFTIKNLPDWIEEREKTAKALTIAWCDCLEGIFAAQQRLKGGT